MSTSGAISGVAFSFSYALPKATTPTEFFTGTFTAGDVKVVKRSGGTTSAAVNITTLPTHKYEGVFQFDLSASEMTADEVVVVINAATADVVDEAISIVTETSTADVRKVVGSAVTGIADFRATGFSTFDPAVDAVANVTTVGSVTGSVGSVTGSVGSVVAAVTAGTVTDKTGYSITGTLTTLDALDTQQDLQHATTQSAISGLNDIAATDIVSAGPITTLSGAVVNVDLVDVTTTNTDMRGTDGAYTGTPATAGQIADAVWDESYSAHTTAGTFGKLMDIIRKANLSVDGTVSGTPTVSAFDTDLTDPTGAHDHQLLLFVSGSLTGYSMPIDSYSQTNGRIVLQEDFPTAPSASDEFVILPDHIHPVSEIQDGLATSAALAVVDANVDSILADTSTDGVVISTAQAQSLADEVLKRSVTNTQDSADAHSLASIVLAILESSRSSSTWTIRKTTGATFTTKTLTLDSAAQPVTGVD